MVLGAALPLELRKSRLARDHPVRGAKEVLLNGDDIADGTVVDPPDRLSVPRMVATLQTGNKAQSFLRRQFRCSLHELDPGRVDAVRFLHEHVLPGLNRGHRMEWMELGCVGNQHYVR